MFKLQITVATMLALASGLAAANSTICVRNTMLVPCDSKAWEIGVNGLYLQPSFGGNGLGYTSYGNYGGADNQGNIVTNNGINYMHNVTPQWDMGFQLHGAYAFSAANDVNVDWFHFSENVNGHLPPGSLFSGSVDGFYAGALELSTRWDAVNVEAGQHINLSEKKLIRIYAGVQVARVKNTFTNHPKLFTTTPPYFTSTDTLSFNGVGPRVGVDFAYAAMNGFSLYTKFAGSLLVGDTKQAIAGYRDVTNAHYGLIIFGIPNYTYTYNNVVVPEVEAKLGVSYNHQFTNGNLGLDLGYLWMNYIHAISSYTGVGIVASSVGVPDTSNFNLNGMYFGMKWSM